MHGWMDSWRKKERSKKPYPTTPQDLIGSDRVYLDPRQQQQPFEPSWLGSPRSPVSTLHSTAGLVLRTLGDENRYCLSQLLVGGVVSRRPMPGLHPLYDNRRHLSHKKNQHCPEIFNTVKRNVGEISVE
ncbi:hypothetical protein INR49_022165 [Caranx melampygus]|nr:hypothetical protein INR49_022165 [Caranx melampygus]